ncbi:MAG: hypothetical protein ABH879_05060 [archaeon]
MNRLLLIVAVASGAMLTWKLYNLVVESRQLKKSFTDEQNKNDNLEQELKRLKGLKKHNNDLKIASEDIIPESRDSDDNKNLLTKYPKLPKNELDRIEIQRTIARSLTKTNGGTFHISQIMKTVEGIYRRHISPEDRVTLLNDIKNWIERDPLCKSVKSLDSVNHYTFI